MLIRGFFEGGYLIIRVTRGGEVRGGKISFHNGSSDGDLVADVWTEDRTKAKLFPEMTEKLRKFAASAHVSHGDRVVIEPAVFVDAYAHWVDDHRYRRRVKHRAMQRSSTPPRTRHDD